jgi:dimethylamine/trimethylamine dehydrogenase
MGEEWRRSWHPEFIRPKRADARVLVVGGGPAGLEAAHALGKRGYEVVLVEASRQLGGRVAREAALPGLASWRRVIDYRAGQIDRLPNVEYYFESEMTVDEALGYGFDHICVATGATWRADGGGRSHPVPLKLDGMQVLTPDDLMAGARPGGPRVVLFDDDHYYLGGVLAELLAGEQFHVEIVTPEPLVSAWTVNTMEQKRIHRRLLELGVSIRPQHTVTGATPQHVTAEHVVTGAALNLEADCLVVVTGRTPNDELASGLTAVADRWDHAGLTSVRAIGDAWAPSTIASAVWWGRRYAEELGEPAPTGAGFRRE